MYAVAHGRCAIGIDYQATGDVISWNEINDALAAVLVKVEDVPLSNSSIGPAA